MKTSNETAYVNDAPKDYVVANQISRSAPWLDLNPRVLGSSNETAYVNDAPKDFVVANQISRPDDSSDILLSNQEKLEVIMKRQ